MKTEDQDEREETKASSSRQYRKRYYRSPQRYYRLKRKYRILLPHYYRLGKSFDARLWTPEALIGGRAVLERYCCLKRYYRDPEAEVPLSGSTVYYCRDYYRLGKFIAARLWILEGPKRKWSGSPSGTTTRSGTTVSRKRYYRLVKNIIKKTSNGKVLKVRKFRIVERRNFDIWAIAI